MSRGTPIVDRGLLNMSGRNLVLRRDGGGQWRLDCGLIVGWRARRLVGTRVQIEGVRDAFDIVAVEVIAPAE